ncbi:MAG: hypothetical protein ACMXYA_01490, partial [Candidatus Woesearchaeota archaeon]
IQRFAKTKTQAYAAWLNARDKKDFDVFKPHLQKLFRLLRKKAELLDKKTHPYTVLLDEFEEGMTVEEVQTLFRELKPQLISLYKKVKKEKKFVKHKMPSWTKEQQEVLTEYIIDLLIPDRERFGIGETTHPFMTQISPNDIRIATAYRTDPLFSLTSTVHECGHALYELQLAKSIQHTNLAQGATYGIHESQSRLWENCICSSKEFLKSLYPKMKKIQSQQAAIPFSKFYHHANALADSLVRVEGDEITYCLHIIIRFEIEVLLLTQKLSINEVETYWNAEYKKIFGKKPKHALEGILQDVHWSQGYVGYFPTYALGTLYSVIIYYALEDDIPQFHQSIQKKDFSLIREWLKKHVHSFGKQKSAKDIMRPLLRKRNLVSTYISYLESKYLTK